MELKFCELPQGMRFVTLDESESGLGLYIPRDSLDAPAAISLCMMTADDYINRRKAADGENNNCGYLIWFSEKGRRFMDERRRFADLLHFIGADKTGEVKEEFPELDKLELSRLAFYNDRVNNIYVAVRDGKADLQSYPVLARLECMGLIDISLIDEEEDPQPERFFRISVTDRGREVLRRSREKDR